MYHGAEAGWLYVSINKSLTFLFACVRASVLSVAQRQLLNIIVHVVLIQVVLILYSLHVKFHNFPSDQKETSQHINRLGLHTSVDTPICTG
jgi:archaellum biogenesis protein FlaJ (TadC family)